MKTKLIIFTAVLALTLGLTGCSNEQYVDMQGNSYDIIGGRFVVLDECEDHGGIGNYNTTYITYDKNTKVMYYILDGYYRTGLCPMYDTNGNIMVYGGDK